MRVTTKMMNNSIMTNISKNKNKMYDLDEQYNSGKKIQKPSDDPIIAVRSLKLRTTISEVNQYLDKNIPDATSWMDITSSSLTSMNDILTSIYSDVTRGANDTLATADRNSIAANLKQLGKQIYQEGNANYAGRYVFTGFKTDTPLTFSDDVGNLNYKITESFSGSDIDTIKKVSGGYNLDDYDVDKPDATQYNTAPELTENIYRLRLGYDNLDAASLKTTDITVATTDATGKKETKTLTELGYNVSIKNSTDNTAYQVGDDDVVLMSDTGELVFGKNVYDKLRLVANDDINITYSKNKFLDGECRPEHYYDCVMTNQFGEVSTFNVEKQDIYYEINFGQKIKVNSQIGDVLGNDFGRTVNEIISAVEDVTDVENKIAEVDKMLSNTTNTTEQTKALNRLKEQMNIELAMKTDIMTETFETGLDYVSRYQSSINVAEADLGSRMSRLEMVEDRLDSQLTDYTDLLSENEDADIVDTYINLTSAENVYNASLSMAAKVTKQSLMDFI